MLGSTSTTDRRDYKMRIAQKLTTLVTILGALFAAAPGAAQTNETLVGHSSTAAAGTTVPLVSRQNLARVTTGDLTRPADYWVVTEASTYLDAAANHGNDFFIQLCKTRNLHTGSINYLYRLHVIPSTCSRGVTTYSGNTVTAKFGDGGYRMNQGEDYAVVMNRRAFTLDDLHLRRGVGVASGKPGWAFDSTYYNAIAGDHTLFAALRRGIGQNFFFTLKGRAVQPGEPVGRENGPVRWDPDPEHWSTTSTNPTRPTVYGLGDEIRFRFTFDATVTADQSASIPITVGGVARRAVLEENGGQDRTEDNFAKYLYFKYAVRGIDSGSVGVPVNALASASDAIHPISALREPPTAASLGHADLNVSGLTVSSARRGPAPESLQMSTRRVGSEYGFGEDIEVSLTLTGPVTVPAGNTPELRIGLGDNDVWATYDPDSSSAESLVFSYEVQAEDYAPEGVELFTNLTSESLRPLSAIRAIRADLRWPEKVFFLHASDRATQKVNGRADAPPPPPAVLDLTASFLAGNGNLIPNGADVSWNGPSTTDLDADVPIVGYEYRFGRSPNLTGPWTLLGLSPSCVMSVTAGQCPAGEVELRDLEPNGEYWFEVRAKGVHTASGTVFSGEVAVVSVVPQSQREPDPVRYLRHDFGTDGGVEVHDVTIQWYPPVSPGLGAIEHYEWELDPPLGWKPATSETPETPGMPAGIISSTSIQLDGTDLLSGESYVFKVRVCAEEAGATGAAKCTAPVAGSTALRSTFESVEFTPRGSDNGELVARWAVIREDELVILFAKQLSTNKLDETLFTVTKNGVDDLVVNSAFAESDRVTLAVSPAVARADSVTLDYSHGSCSDPVDGNNCVYSGNGVTDLAGNPASELPDHVKNVTNATGQRPTNPPTDVEPPRPIEAGGVEGSRVVLVFSEDLAPVLPPANAFNVRGGQDADAVIRSIQICGPRLQLNLIRGLEDQDAIVEYVRPSTGGSIRDGAVPIPNHAETFYGHRLLYQEELVGCDTTPAPPTSKGTTLTAPELTVEVFGQDSLYVHVDSVPYVDEVPKDGVAVGGYLVQWRGPGGRFRAGLVECGPSVTTGVCESTERVFDISGLEPETQYFVRARAWNGDSVSPWSEATATTLGPLHPPLVSAEDITESSATLVLEHDGDASDFVTASYEVEWRRTDDRDYNDDDVAAVVAPDPPQTVEVALSGLDANEWYTVRARAVGTSGATSAWTGGLSFTTDQTESLEIVTSVTVTASETSATVSYDRIAGASDYRVDWKESSASSWPAADEGYTTRLTTYGISGLTAHTEYEVRVRGERGDLYGGWSETVTFTTRSPRASPNHSRTNKTHESVTVVFTAAEHTRVGASRYEAQARPVAASRLPTEYGAFTEQADETWEATIHGLVPDTKYVTRTRSFIDGVWGGWGSLSDPFNTDKAIGACNPNFSESIDESTFVINNPEGTLDDHGLVGRYWVKSTKVSISFAAVPDADDYIVYVARTYPVGGNALSTTDSTTQRVDLTKAGDVKTDIPTEYQISVRPTCSDTHQEFEGEESQPLVAVYSNTDTSPEPLASAAGYMRPNTAPVATADSAIASEDVSLIIPVLGNDEDVDGDNLEVIKVSQPAHGSARITDDGEVEYQSANNFNGTDRFSYTVSDGRDTAEAGVDVTVEAVNDPPEPVGLVPDQTVEVATPVTVGLAELFRDPDGDELRYTAVVAGSAMVSVTGSQLLIEVVEPGASVVTVTAADPEGLTAEQVIAVQGTDNRPRDVVEDTLAAIGRGYLASARATLSRRVESNGREQSRVTIAGVSVPMTASSAQQWLTSMAGPSMRTESAGMMPQQPADTGPREDGIRSPFMGSGPTEFMVGFGGTGEEEGSGRRWTAWGQSDMQMFDGGRNSATYGGSLLSTYVGVDAKLSERWLAGLAVSRSRAEADWSFGGADGLLTTSMTSLQPYIRWADEKTSVWAMAGGGSGDIGNDRLRYGLQEQNGLGLRLGLAEARRQLGTVGGGMHLALRGDASWAHLSTDEGVQLIDGIGVGVHQLRMGVDVSSSFIAGGAEFEPFGEVHARRDGGSGQTGSGMELAGGLRVSRGIFRVEGMGRMLTMHSAENYRERGAALMLSVGEGARQPGLTLSLQPRWGAPASGSQMLWQDQLYGSMQDGDAQSLDARVDYGVQAWGGLISPFSLYGSSQYGQRMQLGMSVGVGRLQLESSVERNADPLRGGTATRVSIMGSLSLSGR